MRIAAPLPAYSGNVPFTTRMFTTQPDGRYAYVLDPNGQ